jgi:hypothetical protein
MKKLIPLTALLLFAAELCLAQADLKPKKAENPQWREIVYVDFYTGKNERAMAIIKDYFIKATNKAGLPGPEMMLTLVSGEWDIMLVWKLKGGVEDLNWDLSPDNIAWMKALNEIAGGADKGKAIMDEYLSLISRTSVYLGRM